MSLGIADSGHIKYITKSDMKTIFSHFINAKYNRKYTLAQIQHYYLHY